MKAPDARLKVWLRTKNGYAGAREFPLATETRPAARISIEFAIALLDGDSRFSLQELLDAEGVTSRFYREIRDQIGAVTASVSGSHLISPSGFAQRLLGRLLFLRFLEEKEWLPRNKLRDGWKTYSKDYYRSFLLRGEVDRHGSGARRARRAGAAGVDQSGNVRQGAREPFAR